jgi:fimbrial chaperone protein
VKRRLLLVAAAGAFVLGGRPRAANLEISPVLVELGPKATNATVTVRNAGTTSVRYQVYAMAWTEPSIGETKLVPSKDLAAFPPLFALGPGEERKVRVGPTVAPGADERAWRLFVEELPSTLEGKKGAQIAIRTRFAIPVFQGPMSPRPSAAASLVLDGGTVKAVLRNTGNVHFRPRGISVTFSGAAGEKLHSAEVLPAVLLALAERSSNVPIPADVCGKVRKATLAAELPDETLRAALDLPGGACAP